jgi:hypothetical protein
MRSSKHKWSLEAFTAVYWRELLIGYLTWRVFLFYRWFAGQNKGYVDFIVEIRRIFQWGNPENKKYLRDLSKGNQKKVV